MYSIVDGLAAIRDIFGTTIVPVAAAAVPQRRMTMLMLVDDEDIADDNAIVLVHDDHHHPQYHNSYSREKICRFTMACSVFLLLHTSCQFTTPRFVLAWK
jgi:hypothetical protein